MAPNFQELKTGFEKKIEEAREFHASDAFVSLLYEMNRELRHHIYIALPTDQKPRCRANVVRQKSITRCNRKVEFESNYCASHRLESSRIKVDPRYVRKGAE